MKLDQNTVCMKTIRSSLLDLLQQNIGQQWQSLWLGTGLVVCSGQQLAGSRQSAGTDLGPNWNKEVPVNTYWTIRQQTNSCNLLDISKVVD